MQNQINDCKYIFAGLIWRRCSGWPSARSSPPWPTRRSPPTCCPRVRSSSPGGGSCWRPAAPPRPWTASRGWSGWWPSSPSRPPPWIWIAFIYVSPLQIWHDRGHLLLAAELQAARAAALPAPLLQHRGGVAGQALPWGRRLLHGHHQQVTPTLANCV